MPDETVVETVVTEETQPIAQEQAVNTENAEPIVPAEPEKTFTQSELNDIIKNRIERERESISKKTAQEARDAYIAEQGYTFNGQPIKTEAEYNQAVQDAELTKKYKEQELPDDVIQELLESKKFREQYQTERQTQAQKDKQDAEFKAFFDAYPTVDPSKDIPPSVWEEVGQGKSLLDAYVKHENQTLKEQLAAVTAAKQIEQQNNENASSSTGSVTGNGTVATPTFFTKTQVDAMSLAETNKNWATINESMKNPKFYD